MEESTDQHPPMQGDDELAKALQGGLQFEETPTGQLEQPQNDTPPSDQPNDDQGGSPALPQPPDDEPPAVDHPHDEPHNDDNDSSKSLPAPSGPLDKLKSSALEELKPLVGKLNLPAEERFDTLLLIIRSTDDQSLLDEAFDAAKSISDDNKRAQALLDVIKEVDYFSTKR